MNADELPKGQEESPGQAEEGQSSENENAPASEAQATMGDTASPEKLQEEIARLNDKYLRLYSDFENYKKRMMRDRIEMSKTAGSEIFIALLPVLDDFDRAKRSMTEAADLAALKDGIALVHSKMKTLLQQKGLVEMKAIGTSFDPELHDAVTSLPAESEDKKGTVLEELEKGYYLNGKVLRHAKVVVGQ